MTKRILIFSLAYYPQVGGAEIALKEITDRFSEADFEFHLLTLRFGNEPARERIGNVWVHRVGSSASYISKILYIPRAALAARRLHLEHPFDAFWALMSYMVFPIVLLRLMGIRLPYLLTLQDGDPWQRVYGRWFIVPFLPLLSYGVRKASAVQAISSYLAAWARRLQYQGEVAVIPNGVALERYSAAPEQHEGTILITTSRLVHKNALDDVIRALPLLPASVRFVVHGTGPLEGELKTLAERLGVADRVSLRGYLPHEKLPEALAAADIFVRPSRSEGMGNSFIEAMAAGLPVIGTQEGGIADFLFDEQRNPGKAATGWAVDVDAPEQIADAVKEILTNPRKVQAVRENAYRLVRERHDWSDIAKRMQALLTHVCSAK